MSDENDDSEKGSDRHSAADHTARNPHPFSLRSAAERWAPIMEHEAARARGLGLSELQVQKLSAMYKELAELATESQPTSMLFNPDFAMRFQSFASRPVSTPFVVPRRRAAALLSGALRAHLAPSG